MAYIRVRCMTWSSQMGWHDKKPGNLDDKKLWIAPWILSPGCSFHAVMLWEKRYTWDVSMRFPRPHTSLHWQDGRLPLPEGICVSSNGCHSEGIGISFSSCLILGVGGL
eukprot:1149464-Pelagomonas_calceolata.AAC.1